MVILEDVVEVELVNVIHLNLTLFAGKSEGGVLVEDVAIVSEHLALGQGGHLFGLLVYGPGLDILVFVEEGAHPDCHLNLLVLLHSNEYNPRDYRVRI